VSFTDLLQVQLQLLLQFKDAALMFALHLKHMLLLQSITQHTYSMLVVCNILLNRAGRPFSPDGHFEYPYGSYGRFWAAPWAPTGMDGVGKHLPPGNVEKWFFCANVV